MSKDDQLKFWSIVATIPTVALIIPFVLVRAAGGSEGLGVFTSILVAMVAEAIFIPAFLTSHQQAECVTPGSPAKPKSNVNTTDLDKEREERLKELKEAMEDPDNPLDEITVGAQERDIEADYQRKLAERMS